MPDIKQSTARNAMVFMTDSSDHVSGKASLTLTITASKAGAAFASITPTVTERGSGWYSLALTTSHTDTLGDLAIHVTGSGADPTDKLLNVVANILGDTQPANVTQILGSTADPSVAQLGVNVVNFAGTPVTNEDGTAQGGTSTTITLASGSSGVDDTYKNRSVTIVGGTGVGQSKEITGYVGATKVATVDSAWATTPDNTSTYTLGEPIGLAGGGSGVTAADVWDYLTTSATTSGSLGKLLVDNVNATVASRQATFTTSTGVTLPSSVASPTNITAGTITTVTNLTNLPAITTDWLTGTGVAASAVTKIQSGLATPTNITAGTITTVTNLTNAPTAGDLTATMKGSIGTAVAASAVASVTGNVGGNVVGSVGSVSGLTTGAIAAGVWDLATSGHTTSGTFGAAMNAAGSAGDPWATNLPGAYGAGTAGYLIGHNVTGVLALAGSAPSWYAAPVDVSANVSAIKAKTDNLPASPASTTDVTGLMTTAMTESYAADGSAMTPAQALHMVWSALSQFEVSGTSITARKLDGSTQSMVFTMDSSTTPTSRTRSS